LNKILNHEKIKKKKIAIKTMGAKSGIKLMRDIIEK
jgi:hypothetical protein